MMENDTPSSPVLSLIMRVLPDVFPKVKEATGLLINKSVSFPILSEVSADQKVLYFAVTSAPSHADLRSASRRTYLKDCHDRAGECAYKFFVDAVQPGPELLKEAEKFGDLVFRNENALMDPYPDKLNYGVKFPAKKFNNTREDVNIRYYKIDWKISFMKWIKKHERIMPHYLSFIEDDSFACTSNLLVQLNILLRKSRKQRIVPFVTGSLNCQHTRTCNFDDSSMLMSGQVASAISHIYPTQYNCPGLAQLDNETVISWGRSWRPNHCNWRYLLESNGMKINVPDVRCKYATMFRPNRRYMLCGAHPLILHTHGEQDVRSTLSAENLFNNRICRDFLLLDKVKNPAEIEIIYNMSMTGLETHADFSAVFMNDGVQGWSRTLNRLETHGNMSTIVEFIPYYEIVVSFIVVLIFVFKWKVVSNVTRIDRGMNNNTTTTDLMLYSEAERLLPGRTYSNESQC